MFSAYLKVVDFFLKMKEFLYLKKENKKQRNLFHEKRFSHLHTSVLDVDTRVYFIKMLLKKSHEFLKGNSKFELYKGQ